MKQLLLCLFLVTPALGENVEDKTGEVFPGLAELTALRDKIRQTPHIVVAIGEKHHPPGKFTATKTPFFAIRGFSADGFKYRASCTILRVNSTRHDQRWVEVVDCDSGLFLRRSSGRTDDSFKKRPDAESRDDFLGTHVMYLDPFEDMLSFGMKFTGKFQVKNFVEDWFLDKATFNGAGKGGSAVVSKWDFAWQSPDYDPDDIGYSFKLVQDQAFDYLPTRVAYTGKRGFYTDAFTKRQIQWKKTNGMWLPSKIKTENVEVNNGPVWQNHVKLFWCFDKEVLEATFKEQKNYKEHVMRHFDLPFASRGSVTPLWSTPEDLYMSEK